MAYLLEQEMIPDLTASLPVLFGDGQAFFQACEVPDGARVVDIVFANTQDPKQILKNWKSCERGLNRLSIPQLSVLSLIWRERRITIRKLSATTWLPAEVIRHDYLEPFLEVDLVRRSGRKSYEPTDWSIWEPGSVYTVEAKLKDWQCALDQAFDNKKRSDFSYVAFPSGRFTNKEGLHKKARSLGIGIIEVNSESGSSVLVNARRTNRFRDPGRWLFYLRILIGLLRKNSKWALAIQ